MRLLFAPVLLPLSLVFALASYLRSKFYDWKLLKSYTVPTKIVCVGNITSGGTGKTPIVMWLSEELSKKGKKVCILSRGYKRFTSDVLRVDPLSKEAEKYGDEPLQLAKQLSPTPVYVGADRVLAAQKIWQDFNPDVIILDDGLQHRRLNRTLDFLIFDATQPWWYYLPLPLGYAREGRWAMKRASAIFVTKTNLAKDLEFKVERPVVQFTSNLQKICTMSGQDFALTQLKNKKVALLSAIARPQIFEKQVRELGLNVLMHEAYRDHHFYQESEVRRFLTKATDAGCDFIVVTEKDAVKLRTFDLPPGKILVAQLQIHLVKGKQEFDRIINGLFT